jgi:hypothetical protein
MVTPKIGQPKGSIKYKVTDSETVDSVALNGDTGLLSIVYKDGTNETESHDPHGKDYNLINLIFALGNKLLAHEGVAREVEEDC